MTRERYAKSREIVEDKIARWSGIETEAMLERMEKELLEKKAVEVFQKRIDYLAVLRGENLREEEVILPEKSKDNDFIEKKEKEENEIINFVKCQSCGIKTKINFNPDPTRPVYCKDCLKDVRRKQAVEENLRNRRQESGQFLPPKQSETKNYSNRQNFSVQKDGQSLNRFKTEKFSRKEPFKKPISGSISLQNKGNFPVAPALPGKIKEVEEKVIEPIKFLSLADIKKKIEKEKEKNIDK